MIPTRLSNGTTKGLETTKWGNIVVDENLKSSIDGIYAGGDIVLVSSYRHIGDGTG